jgi:hypothetical protein
LRVIAKQEVDVGKGGLMEEHRSRDDGGGGQ